MSKQSCIVYGDFEVQVRRLNDTQAARLFRAILAFCNSEVADLDDDPVLGMAWANILSRLQADRDKYLEKCAMNAEIGRLGGKASARSRADAASGRLRTLANASEWKLNYTDTETYTKNGDSAHDNQDVGDSSNRNGNPELKPKKTRSPNPADHRKWPIEVFRDKAGETAKAIPGFTDDDLERFTLHWTKTVQPSNKPLYAMTRAFSLENNLRQWQKNKPEWLKNQDQSSGQPSGPPLEEIRGPQYWEVGNAKEVAK